MNSQRRKAIVEIQIKLLELHTAIETLRDEEQDSFDALPEALQESENGATMENAINALQASLDSIDDANSTLDDAAS